MIQIPYPEVLQLIPPKLYENEHIQLVIKGNYFVNPAVLFKCEQSNQLYPTIIEAWGPEFIHISCVGLPFGIKKIHIKKK